MEDQRQYEATRWARRKDLILPDGSIDRSKFWKVMEDLTGGKVLVKPREDDKK